MFCGKILQFLQKNLTIFGRKFNAFWEKNMTIFEEKFDNFSVKFGDFCRKT